MHFHLPKPLHGWREFVGEVGIIVLGVLIALGAEQLVEDAVWRNRVNRAEATMRLELAQDDGPQAYGRLLIAPCFDALLLRIHDGAGIVPPQQLRRLALAFSPPIRTWDSEAWKTVLSSDVASHMSSERIVLWSSPYRVIPSLTDTNAHEKDVAVELHEALPQTGKPSHADLQTLRRDATELRMLNWSFYRASELILARSRELGAPVPEQIQREMLRDARALYGSCARPPDPKARPVARSLIANLHSLPPRFGT